MSLAEEMLASISVNDGIQTYSAEEEHIVVNDMRQIIVPNSLKTIAVTKDNDVQSITFDCVRYWDGNDLSTFAIYLNYVLPDLTAGTYIPEAITTSDGDNFYHFDWNIKNAITQKSGKISFAITAIKTKQNDEGETVVDKQWSSLPTTDCTIAVGLDISNVPDDEESADILAQMSAILEQIHSNVDQWIENAIVQTTGTSEEKSMSQKAITDEFNLIREKSESVNLFDKNSTLNRNGYIVQIGKTNYTAISGFTVTHPIEAKTGSYTFHTKTNQLGANATSVAPCDVNGNISSKILAATDNGDNTATIVIDESWGGTHFAVNVFNSDIDSFMVVKGESMPTKYFSYGEAEVKIKDGLFPDFAKIYSRLYKKKISLNGDSICYGAGSTGGYGKFIADDYDMTIQNIAVSGGTIAAETYYHPNGVTSRHWICRTIDYMDTDADYVILEGGVNDASLGITLGSITPKLNSTLDDTTYYGAFESMLKQLLLRFPGKKLGYIAVHQMTSNFSAVGDESTSYYYAAKKCCAKWGVPFLDLNISCPPFGMITDSNTEMMPLKQAYTFNGDGWHPNEEGYKIYYVPKIVKWLESL